MGRGSETFFNSVVLAESWKLQVFLVFETFYWTAGTKGIKFNKQEGRLTSLSK